MRKEYTMTLSSFVSDFFNAIDDFFGNYTSLYTLIDSQTDRRVYHNIDEELDLIFYHVTTKYQTSKQKIILVVTPEYDATEEIWYQKEIICNGKDNMNSNFVQGRDFYVKNAAYYFPAPTIKEAEKLVCNYNAENNTFMFTVMRDCVFDYSYTSSTVWRTESLFFGTVTKYLSFPGGFFYGGDFVNTYERFYREDKNGNKVDEGVFCIYDDKFHDIQFHKQPSPINHTGFWGQPWNNNPYQQFDCACRNKSHFPQPNNVNRFNAILKAEIDNAPNRRKNNEVDITNIITSYDTIKKIVRNQVWAVTMELDYYVPMVCSITSSTKPLPRYEPLIAHTSIEQGHTVNTLNNITTIMPLWFMVRRDPEVLDNYSGAGKNEVINFVDMFNMASDRMENGTFPIKDSHVYDCFHMGNRRSMFGMRGYSGIAFKQEPEIEYDPDDPSTYPDWLLYPQNLSTCGIVQGHEGKPGFHFFPNIDLLEQSDYILFLFNLKDIGIVYFKIDTSNILSALDAHTTYELSDDAKVYISSETSLPLLPDRPSDSDWQDVASIPDLSGIGFDLRNYAYESHLMFLGNDWFMDKFIDGEAYLCKNT